MVIRKDNQGFTLLETILALFLSGIFTAAVLIMFPPFLTLFEELMDAEDVRGQVVSSLEMVGREASTMRSLYLDNTQCYAICMEYVDPSDSSHSRIFYFWQGSNLMRKKELTSANNVDCSNGGHQFVGNLNNTETTFSVSRELLSVHMSAQGKTNDYQLSAVFMPIVKEREILFTEGFECNTFNQGTGWDLTDGSHSGWRIIAGTQGFGRYEMAHVMDAEGSDTASVEIPIDMTRYPKAKLSFNYRNFSGAALPAGEGVFIDWWDGSTYTTVFQHTDTDDPPPNSTTPIKVDLTSYGLTADSKIRFRAISSDSTRRWYIDNIEVATP